MRRLSWVTYRHSTFRPGSGSESGSGFRDSCPVGFLRSRWVFGVASSLGGGVSFLVLQLEWAPQQDLYWWMLRRRRTFLAYRVFSSLRRCSRASASCLTGRWASLLEYILPCWSRSRLLCLLGYFPADSPLRLTPSSSLSRGNCRSSASWLSLWADSTAFSSSC